MNYRLDLKLLERINAARSQKSRDGELHCAWSGCEEPAIAAIWTRDEVYFYCDRHAEEESERLARSDTGDF